MLVSSEHTTLAADAARKEIPLCLSSELLGELDAFRPAACWLLGSAVRRHLRLRRVPARARAVKLGSIRSGRESWLESKEKIL